MTALSVAPALAPGSRLGPYEIVAPLRAGGMATLFLGRRVGPAGFARHVAIKVVHAHLASDPSFVEMFLDEARLAARIQHPNVIHTEELGEANGMYFLAMEYVHGCSLAQFLMRLAEKKRALAPEVAVHIAMKLADGLHAAHEVKDENGTALGVVHRDVSPSNILLAYSGQVKLIDFGVAKAAGRSHETTGASLKGKIRYMAPEQAWARSVDRRTDVYALGVVLWEALTHRRLFVADNDFLALERVRSPEIPPPRSLAPWIGDALDQAVLTALASEPAARFQTAQAFRRALGGGCPEALVVEPDDLGALLVSVMEDDIERERRSAPPSVTPALELRPTEPARRTGAMAAFTREMPAYVMTGNEALTAAEIPSPHLVVESIPGASLTDDALSEESRVRPSGASPEPIVIPGLVGNGRLALVVSSLVMIGIAVAIGGWAASGYWTDASAASEPAAVGPSTAREPLGLVSSGEVPDASSPAVVSPTTLPARPRTSEPRPRARRATSPPQATSTGAPPDAIPPHTHLPSSIVGAPLSPIAPHIAPALTREDVATTPREGL